MQDAGGHEPFFNQDYLYFTGDSFTPEVNEREANLIRELLGLRGGMRVLDLGCGCGRIARPLARMGCQITGLDSSEPYLAIARAEARAMDLAGDYILGDMRAIPWENAFDRVVLWFNTFGYFGDHENRGVLEGVRRALKPGGQVLIDLVNRDALLRHLPRDSVVEREGNLQIDRHSFDPLSGCLMMERIVLRDRQMRRASLVARLFTFPELRDWLSACAFRSVAGYGSDRQQFSLRSDRLLVVAVK